MGNATDAVKACAKRVTGSHGECGVAQVVEALLAGQWEP
jgi:hydroxymethylpyrimidine pyrophosphatase-like HAD family hydrolase